MYNFEALKAPFDPSLVKHRMGAVAADNRSAVALPYVDAHVVEQRLNEVFGLHNWDSTISVNGVVVTCRIKVNIDGSWVGKEDGTAISDSTPDRREIAVKAAMSDAFKRAAAQWGVGRYFYFEPPRVVPVKVGASGRLELVLPEANTPAEAEAAAAEVAHVKDASEAATTSEASTSPDTSAVPEQTAVSDPVPSATSTAAETSAEDNASNDAPPSSTTEAVAFEVKGSKGMVKVPASLPVGDHERIRSLIPRLTTGCDNPVAVENYRRYLDDPNGRVKPFMAPESVAFLHQVLDQHVALAQSKDSISAAA